MSSDILAPWAFDAEDSGGGLPGVLSRLETKKVPSLRIEPYDPDARDADNDGIVQEGTAWERPAGSRLLDAAGKLLQRGQSSGVRPSGLRVVDADGKPVSYTPTYERGGAGGTLSPSVTGVVREATIGERNGGTIGDRSESPKRMTIGEMQSQSVAPKEVEKPKKESKPEVKPEVKPEKSEKISKRAKSGEEIKEKNKTLLDRLKSIGGKFGKIDKEYDETEGEKLRKKSGVNYQCYSKEERTQFRLDKQNELFDALRHYWTTGERPQSGGEYASWDLLRDFTDSQIEIISPEIKKMIMESSNEELNGKILEAASGFHENIKDVRFQIPVNRQETLLEDGVYRTAHEVKGDHALGSARYQTEAKAMGVPYDAPSELRPASAYLTLNDQAAVADAAWADQFGDAAQENDLIRPEFAERQALTDQMSSLLNLAGEPTEYGEITVVLKPETSGRVSYNFGDSINDKPIGVALASENDPEEIANIFANTSGFATDGRHSLLRLLDSAEKGDYADVNVPRTDSDPRTKRPYVEAQVLGGFELGEVESVTLPHSARMVNLNAAANNEKYNLPYHVKFDDVIEEFYSSKKLESMGFSPKEIDWIQNQISLMKNGNGGLPGQADIEKILELRRAKELNEKWSSYGIKVYHTHPLSRDILDAQNYGGGKKDDDPEEILMGKLPQTYEKIKEKAAEALKPKPRSGGLYGDSPRT
jgi:hypothetical protein